MLKIDEFLLSFAWNDKLLYGQITYQLSLEPPNGEQVDPVTWVVNYCNSGVLIPGNYQNGFHIWTERGEALRKKIEDWLVPDEVIPQRPATTLIFELTESGRKLIPEEFKY